LDFIAADAIIATWQLLAFLAENAADHIAFR